MIQSHDTPLPPHCRVLASAGSGKTYQLTTRYLTLLSRKQPAPSILATTFTRLAAGEIRDRVISRLLDALGDKARTRELSGALGAELNDADIFNILRSLFDDLHRLQIRTLDSFFASVVQNFAPELGQPIGCAVVDEAQTKTLRDDSIASMLEQGNESALIDLLRQLTTADAGRAVHDVLDREIKDLHDICRDAAPDAWDAIDPPQGRLTDQQLADAIAQLQANCPNADNGHWVNAHTADVARASEHDWQKFLTTGIAGKVNAGEDSFYRKPIDSHVCDIYQPLVVHATAVLFDDLRGRNRATAELLAQFASHYDQLKHQQRLMTFSDLAPLLARAVASHSFDEICFRLDTSIEHLLLDEFQDTSIAQWNALRPIVANMLSDATRERTFYCVGDIKQSIYGWRSAAPVILQRLPELIFESGEEAPMHNASLPMSWRSSQPVIDAVNDVFSSLQDNQALRNYPDVAIEWSGIFEEHSTVKDHLPGYVELRTMPQPDEDEEADHIRLARAATLAADLHRARPDISIGVLCRANKSVGRLLFELGPNGSQQLNVPAGGRGTGSLLNAPVVETLLDLFTFADHPEDTLAAFHIASSPVAELYDIDANLAHLPPHRRAALAAQVRRELAEDGYADTIARWTVMLAPHCTQRELQRIEQLIDLADVFDAGPARRADDFVTLVETMQVPDVRPAPIQVMTVHKAKGLEFDAVILPDLESYLRGSTPSVVYQRDGHIGPIARISRYPSDALQHAVPQLKAMCDSTVGNIVHESLSLLYVAMTRARQGLYMLVDAPKRTRSRKSEVHQTTAGVLLGSLVSDDPNDYTPDTALYTTGDPNWLQHAAPTDSLRPVEETQPAEDQSIRIPRARQRVQSGAAPSAHDTSIEELLRRRDIDADDRGTALHALLEHIEWLPPDTDNVFSDDEYIRIIRRALPRRSREWAISIAREFHDLVQQPAVRDMLDIDAQRGDAGDITVQRELRFARTVNGDLQTGSIDRLVIHRTAASAIRATVIDFKTDRITVDEAPQRAGHYRQQLESYRAAAAEVLKLDAADIECIVLFITAGIAISLDNSV